MKDPIEQHILNVLSENGRMRTKDIIATMPDAARKITTKLSNMTKAGSIESPKRGFYELPSTATSAQPPSNDDLNQISKALRSPDANKETADTLMDIYDDVLAKYKGWLADNIDSDIDFGKQQLFIENLKWIAAIGDKVMKRWSLEHVGYDTNTRQAQEDAKAKTAEREKAALEDAPLREKVMIVGKYDPEAEELLDCLPSSLKEMSDEDTEEIKV